jgi:Anti-sigma-K factor rskA
MTSHGKDNDRDNDPEFDPEFDPAFDAELAELLRHPALWDTPSSELSDRVTQAVAAEVTTVRAALSAPIITPVQPITSDKPSTARERNTPREPSAFRRNRWLTLAAAVLLFVVGAAITRTVTPREKWTTMALAATELEPSAKGYAKFASTPSGLRIELDATGLPRRDGNKFYQAWLKGPTGLVPVGTFHSGEKVTLWAGVALKDFPTLTITQEEVGDQNSSGKKVMMGTVTVK